MKSLFILISLCLLGNTAFAYTLGIVDLMEPITTEEEVVVFGTDGRVYEIASENKELIALAKAAKAEMLEVEVELRDLVGAQDLLSIRNEITKISLSSRELSQKAYAYAGMKSFKEDEEEIASIKNSYVSDFNYEETLQELFWGQRNDTLMRSECYNRAHIWAWELNKHYQNGRKIQTGKIWLFFTRKYIREYKYKWWFHVSPYLTLNGDVRVMDRSFTQTPVDEKSWTDNFMKNYADCPEVFKYTDYENYQYDSYCYVIKSSVFYWQPYQVENVEKRNIGRHGWNKWELRKAYRQAIGRGTRVP